MEEMNNQWNRVNNTFRNLECFAPLRPTVAAMLRLIAALRDNPRLSVVAPSVSLASLNLKVQDSKRYVVVAWDEKEPQGFEISFVDPPLEFSGTTTVCEAKAVETIIEYLGRIEKRRGG